MWYPFKRRRERLEIARANLRARADERRKRAEDNARTWYCPAAEALKRGEGWDSRFSKHISYRPSRSQVAYPVAQVDGATEPLKIKLAPPVAPRKPALESRHLISEVLKNPASIKPVQSLVSSRDFNGPQEIPLAHLPWGITKQEFINEYITDDVKREFLIID